MIAEKRGIGYTVGKGGGEMDAMKTGGLIARRRKEKELTQRDLAEGLHVSVQAVSKWERGVSQS